MNQFEPVSMISSIIGMALSVGMLFAVGLFFLSPFFVGFLGWGEAEYLGPQ